MVLGLAKSTSNWRGQNRVWIVEVVYRTCSGLATTVLGEQLVGKKKYGTTRGFCTYKWKNMLLYLQAPFLLVATSSIL